MAQVKWSNIKRRGKVVGRIEVFWSIRLKDWVTVPGVSKYESQPRSLKLKSLINKFGQQ
jgi:hypothetical protein